MIRALEGEPGATVVVDGDRVLNLASDDFLGLATGARVREAARQAVADLGTGAGVVEGCGVLPRTHVEASEALARFVGAEAVCLTASERDALALVATRLAGPGTAVVLDAGTRPALAAAWRMAGAEVRRFPHRDVAAATRLLGEAGDPASRPILATEGLFGLAGDVAPVAALAERAREADALFLIDESCAVGILGDRGRGSASLHDLDPGGWLRVGSLGRSLGATGGWVAGGAGVVDRLLADAPGRDALPLLPCLAAAAVAGALEQIDADPGLLERLWSNAHHFHAGLDARSIERGDGATPIVVVPSGEPANALRRCRELLEAGLLVRPTLPPATPRAALRMTVTAAHDEGDLDAALEILGRVL